MVPWDQVEDYMHLEAVALPSEKGSADEKEASGIAQSSRAEYFVRERKETPETFVSEEELEEIFKRTYYQNSEPKSKKGYQKRCQGRSTPTTPDGTIPCCRGGSEQAAGTLSSG